MSEGNGVSRRDFLKVSSGIVLTAAGGVLGVPGARRAYAEAAPAGSALPQGDILQWDMNLVPKPDFWFMALSDTHVTAHTEPWRTEELFLPAGAERSWKDVHQMNIGRFIKVIEQANASKPDFVMHLGDITTSHPQRPSWDTECLNSQKLIATLKMPVHLCAGNHDTGNKLSLNLPNWPQTAGDPRKSFYVSDDNMALYRKYFGEPYYSFDHKASHFIVLLEHVFGSGWNVEKEEWDWLEADLAAHKDARHIFMFFHTPIYWVDPVKDLGPGNYEIIDEGPRARLLGLINKYGVRAVFTGHTHHNITNQYGNTGLFTVTSTAFARNSWQLYTDLGGGNRDPAHAGYLVVRVYGDNVVVNFVRTVDRMPDARPVQQGKTCLPKRLLTRRSEDGPRMPFAVTAPLPYVVPRMWGCENVIDGRLADPNGRGIPYVGWTSDLVRAENANEWIQIDFEKPAALTKVVLVGRGSSFPMDFGIEARNGDGWKEIHSETDFRQPRNAEPVEFPLSNVKTSAIRVVGTRLRPDKPGRPSAHMSFLQIEAYDDSGVNVALAARGGRATASSHTGRSGTHSNDNAWAQALDVGNAVRVSVQGASWEDIEVHKGRYLLPEHWKPALLLARAKGAPVVFPVTVTHPLYEDAQRRDAFPKYVRAVVNAVGDYVDGWELHLGESNAVDKKEAMECLRALTTIARARNTNAAVVIQGMPVSQKAWIAEAVSQTAGMAAVVLPPAATISDMKELAGTLGTSALCLAEIDAGSDIYDAASGEAAARRFVEVVSANAFPSVKINGAAGLTDYHDDPGAAYYALRALATALAGGRPGGADLLRIETDRPRVQKQGFLSDGGDLAVAIWDSSSAVGTDKPSLANLSAKGAYSRAIVVDPMTSSVAEAEMAVSNGSAMVRDIELRPYPLVVRLES